MPSQEEFQHQVFLNIQDMIKFADTKSSLSLATVSILVSITLGSSLLSNIVEKLILLNNNIIILYILIIVVFIILASLTISYSIAVLWARAGEANAHNGIVYYGHIAEFKSLEDYEKKVSELESKDFVREYLKQNFIISKIANKKMEYVNNSIIFLSVTTIVTMIIFILNSYIITIL